MKSQSKGMLCLLFVCLFVVSVRAQAVSVCRVALTYYPDQFVGNLMLLPNNTLQFDDDEQRRERVLLNRSHVSGKRITANSIVLYTKQSFIYNGEPRKHLDFVIITASPGCEAIKKWIEAGMTTAPIPESPASPGPQIWQLPYQPRRPRLNAPKPSTNYIPRTKDRYRVMHERMFGPDYGLLTFADTYIDFSCPSDRGRSRRWSLRDIKNIQQQGTFFLRIEPHSGRKYDFVLMDRGIPRRKFADLMYHIRGNGGMSR